MFGPPQQSPNSTPMNEDKELWTLFSAEAEEHLQLLDSGLLHLEKDATDRATIELVFRSAHSLKGAARMMSAHAIEQQAHGFEDALSGAFRNGEALDEQTVERLYQNIDALRDNVSQALKQQNFAPAIGTQIEKSSELVAAPISVGDFDNQTAATPRAEIIQTVTASAETSEELAPTWKIETMRVDTARLDGLLAMAGELVVSTKRAGRGGAEFEVAQTLREDVQKLQMQQKRALRLLEDALGASAPLLRDIERLFDQYGAKWDALGAVTERLRGAHTDMRRLEGVVGELETEIRAVRLLPLSTLFGQFPRSVRDLAKAQHKRVDFSLEGAETKADKRVIEELKDPLMHMIRNAVDHGIETATARMESDKNPAARLVLRGSQTATHVVIELEDDGRGLDVETIRASALRKNIAGATELEAMSERQVKDLIFAPGFSTAARLTDVSGRGVGLDVVRENVARLRGTVEVESHTGRGCKFRMTLPLTLATTRVLLVRAGGQTLALPIEDITSVQLLAPDATYLLKGRRNFTLDGQPIALAELDQLLDLAPDSHEKQTQTSTPCIVLQVGSEKMGLLVDSIIEEQEIILKSSGPLLKKSRHIAGATILETGDVCLLLASSALMQIAARHNARDRTPALPIETARKPKALLLAEDSIVTRTQEKRILESAGYRVVTAVDGLDAWQKLISDEFDGVVSDIEMPNLDGMALTQRIRNHPRYDELPVVLVTSLATDADRKRGLEVGANAYITKSGFDQKNLLETLRRLI